MYENFGLICIISDMKTSDKGRFGGWKMLFTAGSPVAFSLSYEE